MLPVATKTARNATSSATDPAIVYTKNCVAAGPRRVPPHNLIRKNAGIRLSSQNKNQWKKFNAVNDPNSPDSSTSTNPK